MAVPQPSPHRRFQRRQPHESSVASSIGLLPPEVVPLDLEHQRLALAVLTGMLTERFIRDDPAGSLDTSADQRPHRPEATGPGGER